MEESTVNIMFQNRVKKYGDRVALRYKKDGRWSDISWKEFGEYVRNFALGLISLGLKEKETVCLLSYNRPEWTYADLGILSAGGITVPIYQTLVASDVAYIIDHSEAKIVIVEDQNQLNKILSVLPQLGRVQKIIVFDEYVETHLEGISLNEKILSFNQVLELGKRFDKENPTLFKERLTSTKSEDIATLVYTSGTTGPPKGAIITHSNIMFICHSLAKVWPSDDTDSHLSYLPLAHVYERIGGQFFGLFKGGTICYAQSFDTIGEDSVEAKPTLFIGVPRVYEKIYSRILASLNEMPPLKKKVFNWALNVGKETIKYRQNKKRSPFILSLKYKIADKLVYSKLKSRLGGKVKFLVSSAAPLSAEIQEFFQSVGFLLLEGYGLTETSAPVSLNLPDDYKIGTVGKPLPEVEVKIAEDGEILVKGGNVFKGYFKNEEATAETIIDDWLYTGDVGEIDEDGFLKITDRKKDLIITAGGKNIAPQNIENFIKTDPRLSQVVVIGDNKPYLSALITLNREEIEKYAKEKGIDYANFKELAKHPEIKDLINTIIEEKNRHLSRFETIKKWTILDEDFSIETGELTPTMKVKRKVVNKKYQDLISRMYEA